MTLYSTYDTQTHNRQNCLKQAIATEYTTATHVQCQICTINWLFCSEHAIQFRQ